MLDTYELFPCRRVTSPAGVWQGPISPFVMDRVGCVFFALGATRFPPRPEAEDNLAIAMASFTDNPFAALTIVVAPAILTSATSMLCLGTNNRLGRVVDRTRVVSAQLAHLAPNEQNRATCKRQMEALEVRWTLVLRALRFFYMSLGSFAAAALISLFGSLLARFQHRAADSQSLLSWAFYPERLEWRASLPDAHG